MEWGKLKGGTWLVLRDALVLLFVLFRLGDGLVLGVGRCRLRGRGLGRAQRPAAGRPGPCPPATPVPVIVSAVPVAAAVAVAATTATTASEHRGGRAMGWAGRRAGTGRGAGRGPADRRRERTGGLGKRLGTGDRGRPANILAWLFVASVTGNREKGRMSKGERELGGGKGAGGGGCMRSLRAMRLMAAARTGPVQQGREGMMSRQGRWGCCVYPRAPSDGAHALSGARNRRRRWCCRRRWFHRAGSLGTVAPAQRRDPAGRGEGGGVGARIGENSFELGDCV